MNIEFLATVAVIAPDPINSRNLYVEALGLPLQGEGDGYTTASRSPAASRSGSGRSPRPRRRASEPTTGPQSGRYRRSASSSTSPTPLQSTRRHGSSNRPAMSCCMELARSYGARRSLGCSHPRARSSASPTRPCCTTDSSPRIQQSHLPAAAARRGTAIDTTLALRGDRSRNGIGLRDAKMSTRRAN